MKVTSLLSILTLVSLSLTSSFSPLSGIFATFMKLNVALAQEELFIKEATVSAETKTTKSAQYELPYPGILPDNPLYSLKMLRDRIVDFLVSDSLKKAQFDLLQADKRLNTGIYLVQKGKDKYSLAESTISKGENYFEEAIKNVREAKKQRMDTNDMVRRLSDSSYKHQEVLTMLRNKAPKDLKESFMSLEKRAKDIGKQVESLKPKK